MRILIHDYSGHPFQAELSRQLARRGHSVHHLSCSSYPGGKGNLQRHATDPFFVSFETLSMKSSFERYSPTKRMRQEVSYGRQLGKRVSALAPDVVVFCNTPLLAHAIAARRCARRGIPMVFWLQDLYSDAITQEARKRLGPVGIPIGWIVDRVEKSIAEQSSAIVSISDSFLTTLKRWGVATRSHIIPNWAPLNELPLRPRDNAWARKYDLARRPTVLYSGTLGLKHNPKLLLAVARALAQECPSARVVVVSEGMGRDWLEARQRKEQLRTLVLADYAPYAVFPDVMGSADILLVLLNPDAGRYSVPSKVLSYLCAGRAIVGALPSENPAAATLIATTSGLVVDPSDERALVKVILELLGRPDKRYAMGRAARSYAEMTFDISTVGAEFDAVLSRVVQRGDN